VLVDRADLAESTRAAFTARCTRTGDRDQRKDPVATNECVAENRDTAGHSSLCGTQRPRWRRTADRLSFWQSS
jgi:hypothetical protein